MSTKYKPIFTRQQCRKLAAECLAADSLEVAAAIVERVAIRMPSFTIKHDPKRSKRRRYVNAWRATFLKLAKGLREKRPAFAILTIGNAKLPFASFSALPEFTCPGAGECLRFCYSFTAWRYPAPFARQLQNTLFLRFAKRLISDAFFDLNSDSIVRLYVDGDFDSMSTIGFWFRLLGERDDIKAYGYSKSWRLLEAWGAQGLPFPENYRLNLSSGSRYDDDETLKQNVSALPVGRGEFVAIKTTRKHAKGFDRFDSADYHADVRESARAHFGVNRVFSCPGKCGECLPSGEHACGSDRMMGVLIAIAEHN